jgi:hypothetical protein
MKKHMYYYGGKVEVISIDQTDSYGIVLNMATIRLWNNTILIVAANQLSPN